MGGDKEYLARVQAEMVRLGVAEESSFECLARIENEAKEGPGLAAQSRTAAALKQQLAGLPKFRALDDAKWLKMGQKFKGMYIQASLFSGALAAFIQWVYQPGHRLPATMASLSQQGFKTTRYATDKLLGILSGDSIVEPSTVTAKQAVDGAAVTSKERAAFSAAPRQMVQVWDFGESAKEVAAALAAAGVSMKAEGQDDVVGGLGFPPFVNKWDER